MRNNSNFLDELAHAAENEPGDAKKAWRLLAGRIGTAELPSWVQEYVRRSAGFVEKFEPETDNPAKLAHQLGFFHEIEQQPVGYDYDHIFEWFVHRMSKQAKSDPEGRLNISRIAREYHEEVMKLNGSPDAIRKAYERARARHRNQLAEEIERERWLASKGI